MTKLKRENTTGTGIRISRSRSFVETSAATFDVDATVANIPRLTVLCNYYPTTTTTRSVDAVSCLRAPSPKKLPLRVSFVLPLCQAGFHYRVSFRSSISFYHPLSPSRHPYQFLISPFPFLFALVFSSRENHSLPLAPSVFRLLMKMR